MFRGEIKGHDIYLALFVDDDIIAAKSTDSISCVVQALRGAYDITLGDTSMFAGMQIDRDRVEKSIFLHQRMYLESVINKFGMIDARTVSVPADPHSYLQPANGEQDCKLKVPFREAVGSLTFLTVVSRPDIAFAVNVVSRYLRNHDNSHWEAVKRIIRYLKGTTNVGIKYKSDGNVLKLSGYSDADFANGVETRRSTTGYVFTLAGGPVTWSSQRQKLVTLSTTEAEYVASASAAKEAIWLRKLLSDIGCQCFRATELYIDNQSTIRLIRNPEFHKRTKHIDIRFHFIREKVESNELTVLFVSSNFQLADIFTKALPKDRFNFLCTSLRIITN